MPKQPDLVDDSSFPIPSGSHGFRRALLINPPVYDAQYWARWSQPAGLLRIAALLKEKGYQVDLIDSMETNARGMVPKSLHREDGKPVVVARGDVPRKVYHFGTPWDRVAQQMNALSETPPDEIWITSIMTYWWESTRDAVKLVRKIFPKARILVGGIYPTLAPEHAQAHLDADVVFRGELHEASELWTDLTLYKPSPTYAILATTGMPMGLPLLCRQNPERRLHEGSCSQPEDVLAEIEHKIAAHGIRRFGFYEDNALILKAP